jgi:hypothetical protein
LNQGKRDRIRNVMSRGLFVAVMLVLITGCHTGRRNAESLLERISGHSKTETPKPGELAEIGRASIADECAKQSYGIAKKGLIVSETGLHEDVFALRDRVSYGEIAYNLDEALRLESLLRVAANVNGHPPEQTNCIEEFAAHFETLTDPMVEADERLKELDISAFEDSSKRAQEQAERQMRETEKPAEQPAQPSGSVPHNY